MANDVKKYLDTLRHENRERKKREENFLHALHCLGFLSESYPECFFACEEMGIYIDSEKLISSILIDAK